ncbi:MAG: tetratricopeptide repeat protein [Deltaproteobacteria bacterium]|nr:tetratricopeptide repeat protein [Deltaproteobacteria bacterium]MCB9788457.1 tetratricopeptide repeat protein [Deltaproteobacteria bacterium]
MNKNKLLASAQKYMRKGQYKKAIAEYEKVLKEFPADVRARLNLANLYYRQKDLDRAVESFLKVARIYEDGGFTLKAIAVYKQVLKIVPDREELYVALATNYQQHGLLNEAAAQYREALRLLEGKGDQLGKLNVIRQILELDPENLPDRLRLAEAYSALGQITDAVREFRRVAETLERLGYTEDFQRTAERLLYHQPDDAAMAKRVAASYVAASHPQKALSKLKTAFRAAPRDLEVLGTLADAFNQLGQTHKAVTVLKEMARLYDKSGLENERNECLMEILVLNPDDASARRVVAPRVAEEAGGTIEFEDADDLDPVPQEARAQPRAREASGRVGSSTQALSPLEAARAQRRQQTIDGGPPVPPLPLLRSGARPGPSDDEAAAAAEALIEQMIRESVSESPQTRPQTLPHGVASGDDMRELFESALEEATGAGKASKSVAPPLAESDDFDFDLDGDEDEDDELGFADGGEQTIPDNSFIPPDILAQVQTGMNLVIPGASSAEESEESFDEGQELLRDELQELDFYITNGLGEEAKTLLAELKDRYPGHPYVVRRESKVASLG